MKLLKTEHVHDPVEVKLTPVQEAVRRLIKFFDGQKSAAIALGVTQPVISRWLAGKHFVGVATAFKIEAVTGGEIRAWELCPGLPKPEFEIASDNPAGTEVLSHAS